MTENLRPGPEGEQADEERSERNVLEMFQEMQDLSGSAYYENALGRRWPNGEKIPDWKNPPKSVYYRDERIIKAAELARQILGSVTKEEEEASTELRKLNEEEWKLRYHTLKVLHTGILSRLFNIYGKDDFFKEYQKKQTEIQMPCREKQVEETYRTPYRFPAFHVMIGSSFGRFRPGDPVFDYPGELSITRKLLKWYDELGEKKSEEK